jgi:hypothetical protein
LTAISLPQSVQAIGENCFSKCESLKSFVFEGSLLRECGAGVFAYSGIERIDVSVFVRIGKPKGIFQFTCLRRAVIPAQVEVCHRRCFLGCGKLEDVEFEAESHLRVIERECFRGCGMRKMYFPASLERICESAFAECSNLQTLNFEDGSKLSEVEREAFKDIAARHVTVPLGLRCVGSRAFVNFSWQAADVTPGHNAMLTNFRRHPGMEHRFGDAPF